jgi:damage-control phosphatase, subfamily I
VSQALRAVQFITDDKTVHEKVMREVLRTACEIDLSSTPPAMGQIIHQVIRQYTGNEDPYRQVKKHSNQLGLKMYPELKEKIEQSDDPFEMAVRVAIAGNIIDFAKINKLDDEKIYQVIEDSFTAPLPKENVSEFRRAVADANDILFLGDNAGEIVFDRLLLEQMPQEKITFAVRGGPVINDATMEDAEDAGITELVEVIDNGSDAPGTILENCSEDFVHRFKTADLIVAKGQGNFETLSDVDKNIFFLLKVKCPVVTQDVGLEVGSLVLKRSGKWRVESGGGERERCEK